MGLYRRLRAESKGRPLFVLHARSALRQRQYRYRAALNKILKDFVTKSRQMAGFDFEVTVPGWGLPATD